MENNLMSAAGIDMSYAAMLSASSARNEAEEAKKRINAAVPIHFSCIAPDGTSIT